MSNTALFEAIRAGNSASVLSMLTSDPSLASAKNDSGVSAVLMSAYSGRHEIRDLLVARGATLEIHDAAAVGNLERAKELVEGNPVLAKAFSPDGFPVLALAAVFGHLAVARYLTEHGADINVSATNGSGYNALTGAVASAHTEMVRWLLESGADPNYRYGAGYSPLLTAAANGHLEIVKLLVAHSADANATTSDGKSALTFATERKHPAVADYLRSLGT